MSNAKITFIPEGFREILMGEGVHSVVSKATEEIEERANSNLVTKDSDGYEGEVLESPRMSNYRAGGRWVGFVRATDYAAMADEAEYKSLSRAVTG